MSPKEQEWAGPEALCPGWLDEEVPDGEVPEDTGDPDSATHGYELLQSALRQEGLPLTVDRTKEPRTGTGHGGHGGWRLGAQRQAGGTGVPGTGWQCGPMPADHHLAAGFGPLDMTVCILGSPTAFLPVLLEGGSRCPGASSPQPPITGSHELPPRPTLGGCPAQGARPLPTLLPTRRCHGAVPLTHLGQPGALGDVPRCLVTAALPGGLL